MSDNSIWNCVSCLIVSSLLLLWALLRPPWRPLKDSLAVAGPSHPAAAARDDLQPLPELHRLPGHEEDEPDAPRSGVAHGPAAHDQSRWRPSVALCAALYAAGLLLFLVALCVDSWELLQLSTVVPAEPPSTQVIPVRVPMRFGLSGRKVGTPVATGDTDASLPLNESTFTSGSYRRLCRSSRSLMGCALGFQAGAMSVLIHALIGLSCGAALLSYMLMAWRCASTMLHDRQAARTRKNLLGIAWRVALVHCVCVLACPILWALAAHASMLSRVGGSDANWGDQSASSSTLGPSWVLACLAACASPAMLWCARRALQLLHSSAERHSGGRSGRLLEQELAHAYHRAPPPIVSEAPRIASPSVAQERRQQRFRGEDNDGEHKGTPSFDSSTALRHEHEEHLLRADHDTHTMSPVVPRLPPASVPSPMGAVSYAYGSQRNAREMPVDEELMYDVPEDM